MYVCMYVCMYALQLQRSQLVHLFLLQIFDSLLEIFLDGDYHSTDICMYVCIMYVYYVCMGVESHVLLSESSSSNLARSMYNWDV